ncbi:hypothetical protein HUO09_00350 [Vibrio sp. Y2-5]|uniref:hypothetical protein n=1 Tax=Vibrio sp. Y2-5 TaxID=2743977 RepID=UPI001660F082|nr:hypothetical protein [Vibrio sp. Y2-5]MBD0784796.1 hypothetical protein [Vibrio sp. Y2-5]
MRLGLGITCMLIIFSARSEPLPTLPSMQKDSPHRLFLTSEQVSSEQNGKEIEAWDIVIDGGYAYAIFSDIDVYVGARINQSYSENGNFSENGLLSGVSYQLTERVTLSSSVQSYFSDKNSERTSNIGAELSSRLQLSDDLDLHATLGYQEWQQGVEVGLGFRF